MADDCVILDVVGQVGTLQANVEEARSSVLENSRPKEIPSALSKLPLRKRLKRQKMRGLKSIEFFINRIYKVLVFDYQGGETSSESQPAAGSSLQHIQDTESGHTT